MEKQTLIIAMEKQTLIIAMAEKLHRQDPTKTDEYNWLTAEDIVNKCFAEVNILKEQIKNLSKAFSSGFSGNGLGWAIDVLWDAHTDRIANEKKFNIFQTEAQLKWLQHQVAELWERVAPE